MRLGSSPRIKQFSSRSRGDSEDKFVWITCGVMGLALTGRWGSYDAVTAVKRLLRVAPVSLRRLGFLTSLQLNNASPRLLQRVDEIGIIGQLTGICLIAWVPRSEAIAHIW